MKFRPCIDLHNGKVKQIVGGTLSDSSQANLKTNFVSDRPASYFAELYKNDGLTGGHVIMLGPGCEAAAKEALNAYPGGLQVGGGINEENAGYWLDQGAEAVIVTSYVFRDGQIDENRLQHLCQKLGKERLVLDLSCRRKEKAYYIVTDRWQKFTEVKIDQASLDYFSRYCCEYLIHGVDVEGQCAGVDIPLIELLGQMAPIPTTYAGGVKNLHDLQLVRDHGSGKLDVTVGSALDIFGGSGITYTEAVQFNLANSSN